MLRPGPRPVLKEAPRRESLRIVAPPAQLALAAQVELEELGPVPNRSTEPAGSGGDDDDDGWQEMGKKRRTIASRRVRRLASAHGGRRDKEC